jgi:hypothetical protein
MSIEMSIIWAGKIERGSKKAIITVIQEILNTGLYNIVFCDWIMLRMPKIYKNFCNFKVYLNIWLDLVSVQVLSDISEKKMFFDYFGF